MGNCSSYNTDEKWCKADTSCKYKDGTCSETTQGEKIVLENAASTTFLILLLIMFICLSPGGGGGSSYMWFDGSWLMF